MPGDRLFYLLTYWGTLVCHGVGGYTHRPLSAGDAEPVAFQTDGLVVYPVAQPSERFDAARSGSWGALTLRRRGLFLSAEEGGLLQVSRQVASGWEWFALLSAEDLAALRHILGSNWLDTAAATVIPRAGSRLGEQFMLHLGVHRFDLLQNLPLGQPPASRSAPMPMRQLDLWRDGWKLHRFTLYRPLVYYTAFGAGALNLLAESLRTLQASAADHGDVLVITGASRAEVVPFTAGWDAARLHVWTMPAYDAVDYCAARYLIPHWPDHGAFQPVLYVDTDVAFDRDPQPMFLELLAARSMSVQEEPFARLDNWGPVGAALFADAGIDVGDRKGFNSGIIGIPNVADHAATLLAIHSVIYRHATTLGDRFAISHFDQPFANYVGVVTGAIDPAILTPYIRWLNGGEIRGGPAPLGLCHLWDSRDKRTSMQDYARSLAHG